MADKAEPEYPKVRGRVLIDFGVSEYGRERSLTIRQARVLVNRLLGQLNRTGWNKKRA
jgi:hypothetical protein